MFALRLLLVLGKRLLQSLPKTLTLTHNPNPLPIKQLTTAHAWSIGSGKITRTEQRLLSHQTAITPPLFQTTALRPHVAVSSRSPCLRITSLVTPTGRGLVTFSLLAQSRHCPVTEQSSDSLYSLHFRSH